MSVKTCESLACVAGAGFNTPREGNTQRREKAALLYLLSSFLPLARACLRDFSVCPENNRCLLRRASEFESFKMQ